MFSTVLPSSIETESLISRTRLRLSGEMSAGNPPSAPTAVAAASGVAPVSVAVDSLYLSPITTGMCAGLEPAFAASPLWRSLTSMALPYEDSAVDVGEDVVRDVLAIHGGDDRPVGHAHDEREVFTTSVARHNEERVLGSLLLRSGHGLFKPLHGIPAKGDVAGAEPLLRVCRQLQRLLAAQLLLQNFREPAGSMGRALFGNTRFMFSSLQRLSIWPRAVLRPRR